MDWFWSIVGALDPGEWSAVAGMGALFLGLIAAGFAAWQLRDSRSLRREQAAPYVIVKLEESEAAASLIDFVIVNVGTTPAFDIRLEITPPMVRADEIPSFPFMAARPIANGIKMLAPGQEIRMHFDTAIERDGKDLPSTHEVRVHSKNSKKKSLPVGVFELDAEWKRDSVHAEIRNLHWIGARIEGIEKSAKRIATTLAAADLQERKFRDPASALGTLRPQKQPAEPEQSGAE